MSTLTKTIRLDEEFVDILDDYVKLVKETFGYDITVNSIISGSLVTGFGTYLTSFKMISSNNSSFPEGNPFTKEQIAKVKLYLIRAESFLNEAEFGEDAVDNKVEEVR